MAPETVFRRTPQRQRVTIAGREFAFLLTAALLYSLVRGLTNDRIDAAFQHAEQLISFERSVGIFVETDLQGLVLGHDWIVDAANSIYIYGYWPVFVLTLVWLMVRRPIAYPLYRNAILFSGALSLVLFTFYPLAPPRFLPEYGFVDTITREAPTYRDLTSPAFVNEYAAMPSLHFGWILLLGIAWVALAERFVIRVVGAVMPVFMFAAIVLTGNHYVVDALVGGVVVLVGLVASMLIERRKRNRAVARAIADAQEEAQLEAQPSTIPAQRTGHENHVPAVD